MGGDALAVRIILADEQALFREAVGALLDGEPDLHVVAQADTGHAAVNEALRVQPDCALLDAGLKNCDGIAAARLVIEGVPTCRVIVLAREADAEGLIDALEAGARGYLTKASPLEELIGAVRAVHRGETLVPQSMLGELVSGLTRRRRRRDEAARMMGRLTRREREVLALLARGAGNAAIAEELVISPETARTHIQNAIGKLGVHSRLEAAMFATENGILVDAGREGGAAPDARAG